MQDNAIYVYSNTVWGLNEPHEQEVTNFDRGKLIQTCYFYNQKLRALNISKMCLS